MKIGPDVLIETAFHEPAQHGNANRTLQDEEHKIHSGNRFGNYSRGANSRRLPGTTMDVFFKQLDKIKIALPSLPMMPLQVVDFMENTNQVKYVSRSPRYN